MVLFMGIKQYTGRQNPGRDAFSHGISVPSCHVSIILLLA